MELTREEFQLKQKELELKEQEQVHTQKVAMLKLELELKKDLLKFEHDLEMTNRAQRDQFNTAERMFWAERLLPLANNFGGGMLQAVNSLCEVQKAWVQAQVEVETTRLQTIVNAIKAAKEQ